MRGASDHSRRAYRWGQAVSAPRYSTDVRDDFDRLMADLRGGEFGADVLVLWESSRGSQLVLEWVTMLDLLEQQGILVFVTTMADLSTRPIRVIVAG